jgi:hypothetical protein
MKWDTNKIVSDLSAITGKTVKTSSQPEGGHYCRDIYISNRTDGISIIGFNLDDISDVDTPKEDIEYVEVRTFSSDSEGGLPKNASKSTRDLYFQVVDYFNKKKISIVDQLKDYF